jgi:hypothetical protein
VVINVEVKDGWGQHHELYFLAKTEKNEKHVFVFFCSNLVFSVILRKTRGTISLLKALQFLLDVMSLHSGSVVGCASPGCYNQVCITNPLKGTDLSKFRCPVCHPACRTQFDTPIPANTFTSCRSCNAWFLVRQLFRGKSPKCPYCR